MKVYVRFLCPNRGKARNNEFVSHEIGRLLVDRDIGLREPFGLVCGNAGEEEFCGVVTTT